MFRNQQSICIIIKKNIYINNYLHYVRIYWLFLHISFWCDNKQIYHILLLLSRYFGQFYATQQFEPLYFLSNFPISSRINFSSTSFNVRSFLHFLFFFIFLKTLIAFWRISSIGCMESIWFLFFYSNKGKKLQNNVGTSWNIFMWLQWKRFLLELNENLFLCSLSFSYKNIYLSMSIKLPGCLSNPFEHLIQRSYLKRFENGQAISQRK